MKQKEITFNGKTFPVVFVVKTMAAFEEITGKSFFDSDNKLQTLGDKAALLYAAIIAADAKADISFEDIINADKVEAVNEIIKAFGVINELAAEFFEIPAIEPQPEPAEEQEQKGNGSKN
jgi:hypothetical protein